MIRHSDERGGNEGGSADAGSGGDNNSFDDEDDDSANLLTSPNINATQHQLHYPSRQSFTGQQQLPDEPQQPPPPPPPLSPPPSLEDEFDDECEDQVDQTNSRWKLKTSKSQPGSNGQNDRSELFNSNNRMDNRKRQSFPNISTTGTTVATSLNHNKNNRNSSVINNNTNTNNNNNNFNNFHNNHLNQRSLDISTKAFSSSHNNNNNNYHEQPNAAIIRKHLEKIESLELELERIKMERDSLLAENERLCFQLQMMSEAVKSQQTTPQTPQQQQRLKGKQQPKLQQLHSSPIVTQSCQCPPQPSAVNVSNSVRSSTSFGSFPTGANVPTLVASPNNNNNNHIEIGSSIRHCSSCHQLVSKTTNGTDNLTIHSTPPLNGLNPQSRPNEPNPDNLSKYYTGLKSPTSTDELPHHPHLQNHYLIHHGEQRITNSPQPPHLQLQNESCSQMTGYNNSNNLHSAVSHTTSLPTPTSCHPHHKGLLQRSCALSTESAIQPYSNEFPSSSSVASGVFLSPSSPTGAKSKASLNLPASLNLSPTSDPNKLFGSGHPMATASSSSSNLIRSARATGGSSNSLVSGTNGGGVAASSTSSATAYNGYEISQQLLDKQVSALERKYGGREARDAAIKLQRAFRSYRLQKRFTCLAIQAINHQQLKLQQKQTDFIPEMISQTDGGGGTTGESDANQNQPETSTVPENQISTTTSNDNNNNLTRTNSAFAASINLESQSVESQNTVQINPNHKPSSDTQISYLQSAPNQRAPYSLPISSPNATIPLVSNYEPVYQLPPSILYNSVPSNNNREYFHHSQQQPQQDKLLQKKTSFSSTSSTASLSSLHGISSTSSKPSDGAASSSSKAREMGDQQQHRFLEQPLPLQQQMYKQKLSKQQLQQQQPQLQANNSATLSPSVSHHGHNSSSSLMSQSIINPVAVSFAPGVEYLTTIQAAAAPSDVATAIGTNALENYRKRRYRVGLNLFNKSPSERGIRFLITNGFIEQSTMLDIQAKYVSRFLLTRKGLSRQMIGEYISEKAPFNQAVLAGFSSDIDLSGIIVDEALRKFQMNFRFPGEAQKIERLVENFADRYKECNPSDVLSRDSIFILAFAIIMLNTDLHKPTNNKHRMTPEQWLNNLKGVFSEGDLSSPFLLGIYKRIKKQELQTGADHVTQVLKVQSTIVGKDVPNLCLPHRRLVCYCRLYEIREITRREKVGQHQRDVFLFNDLLLITKTTTRSRNGTLAEYQYRSSHPLDGLHVVVFTNAYYAFGIQISRRVDNKQIACFNARNDLDQQRFVDDLQESIAEMDEMEQLRITKSSSLVHLNSFATTNEQTTAAPSLAASGSSTNSTMHDQNVSMASSGVITSSQTDVTTCFSSLSSIAKQPPMLGGAPNGNPTQSHHHQQSYYPNPDCNNQHLPHHYQNQPQLHPHHHPHYYPGDPNSCPSGVPMPNGINPNPQNGLPTPNSSTGDLSSNQRGQPLNS